MDVGPSYLALGFMPAQLRGSRNNIELGGGQAPKYTVRRGEGSAATPL